MKYFLSNSVISADSHSCWNSNLVDVNCEKLEGLCRGYFSPETLCVCHQDLLT